MAERSNTLFRIVVIGGGISGLTAAYRIHQRLSILGRPTELYVFEAAEQMGGVIQTIKHDGFLLEQGADGFLTEKPKALELAKDLGISRELLETRKGNRRSFVLHKGKLVPVPPGFFLIGPSRALPMVGTPLLSLKGKIRLFKEPFIPMQPQEDETLASFVRRRLGPEVLDRLAQPIVGGIYGADAEKLSLRATFPQFLEMENTGGVLRTLARSMHTATASGARYSLFATLKNGMQSFTDVLRDRLGRQTIRTGFNVTALVPTGTPVVWNIHLADKSILQAHAICLAMSAPAAALMTQSFDPALAGLLASIPYNDSMSAYFAYRRSDIAHPMDGFGFVVPESEKKSFNACTFVHQKYDGRCPKGTALIRAFVGGNTAARLWSNSDADLMTRMASELKSLLQISGPPLFTSIHRMRQAMPQYVLGHLQRVEQIEEQAAKWPNFVLAGNWGRGIGVPDCIDGAERASERLLAQALRY